MKKTLLLSLAVLFVLGIICGCAVYHAADAKNNDIVILFTNDVHCGISDGMGYAGLAAYKNSMEQKTDYVILVDCGDHSQGDVIGALTEGEAIIDIMNAVGYDYAVFGNHEFDFGVEQLYKNVKKSNAKYLCCNIIYSGNGTDCTSDFQGYDIVTCGDKKVAFIGVSTPYTTSSASPATFSENGELVYTFGIGNNGQDFYDSVQKAVDAVKEKGADYVIVIGHLGVDKDNAGNYVKFSSADLVANTEGIDAVLDGHSHSFEPCFIVKDKSGKEARIAQTGTKFQSIGQLTITQKGLITVGLITEYPESDDKVKSIVNEIQARSDKLLLKVAAHKDFPMSVNDAEGVRMIRSREMPIGNLVSDAYRHSLDCDIAVCNGGGIRASMDGNDITYKDIIAVNPFGNSLCVVKLKGSDICDILEYSYRFVEADYKDQNGKAVGESGSFFQVSGLKCAVNTNIPSSVVVDSNDMLLSVGETRRVTDVMVLQNGKYVPIDPDKEYTFGTNDYIIKNGGCGMQIMIQDKELVIDGAVNDYMSLLDCISSISDFSAYEKPEGRINVI